jgi:hypothetical protein
VPKRTELYNHEASRYNQLQLKRSSHRRIGITAKLALSVFAGILLIAAFRPAAALADDYVIRKGDRLSADFHSTPLHLIQRLLDRDAHISMRVPDCVRDRTVSVSFHDLKIDSAIDMLLRDASLDSHASVYGPAPEHKITVIVIESSKIGRVVAVHSSVSGGRVATPPSEGHPLTPDMRRMLSPPPA